MKSKTPFGALKRIAIGVILGAVAVSTGTAFAAEAHSRTAHASSSSVLTLAPTVATSITQNFNPYSATSPLSNGELGAVSLIYEPLLQFNGLNGKVYPWLATKYAFSDSGKKITFTIRQGVKFTDGTAMTAADVAYSYDITKQYPAINIQGLQLTKVQQNGDTVTLTFPRSQYTNLQDIASVYIVPEHIWSKVGNPTTYTDPNPVGTGPFELQSYTAQGVTLSKNPSYWQAGLPKVQTVDIGVYTSNSAVQDGLVSGQIDWASDFIPDVQKLYTSKNPDYHYYGPPEQAVALFPNLKTWPTDQLPVREAISYAMSRSAWCAQAESGLCQVLGNASGLPQIFSSYIASSVRGKSLNATPEVSKAKAVLKAAGWKVGSNGYFEKGGRTLALTIIAPTAFSDWSEEGSILQTNLRAAGIDATFAGQSVTGWRSDMAQGKFQLSPYWETLAIAINPDKLLTQSLDSDLTAPIGKTASGDFVRLDDSAIDADLSAYESSSTLGKQVSHLAPVEQYVASQLPIIPAITDDNFSEYSTQNFTGFPSASDPYEDPAPYQITQEVIILHLTPTS